MSLYVPQKTCMCITFKNWNHKSMNKKVGRQIMVYSSNGILLSNKKDVSGKRHKGTFWVRELLCSIGIHTHAKYSLSCTLKICVFYYA